MIGLEANQYYKVTTSDANGCTIRDSIMLSEPEMFLSSVTDSSNISCYGYADGYATVMVTGGTLPYAYLWDDPGTTAGPAATGLEANQYYHISIIDAKGCTHTDSVLLSQPDLLVTDITDSTNISCYNGSDGTATITPSGGTEPYYYSWDNPDQSTDPHATGLTANIYYHVTVSDDHSCPPVTDSVILSQPPLLIINMTDSTNISCFGYSDGTATVTPSGGTSPFYYLWDDPGNTADSTVSGLSANKYFHVKVTDAHECFKTDSILLSQPDLLKVNPYFSDTICLGSSVGYIITNPSGGTLPYYYLWSNGANSKLLTDLAAGDYTVKVNDSHGCIDSAIFTIHNAVPYTGEKICIVTVDILTGENLIVWEKTPDKGTAYYNLYRENTLMGTKAYNDLSIFKDTVADPETRPYLYYLSVVDTCGNESKLSSYHKPLFLQFVSSIGGVNLTWSKYEVQDQEIGFGSYSIYRGSDSLSLEPLATDIPTQVNVYSDKDIQALERKYYYRIAGELIIPCSPSGDKKTGAEPYHHSLSNLDDNRLLTFVRDIAGKGTILVFPNPMDSYATVQFQNPSNNNYRLSIMDLSGKIVYTQNNIFSDKFELLRGELSSGLYMIELKGPKIYRGRIMIE